jgi:hypothetical protein
MRQMDMEYGLVTVNVGLFFLGEVKLPSEFTKSYLVFKASFCYASMIFHPTQLEFYEKL